MQHADLANCLACVDVSGLEDSKDLTAPFFCVCFPMLDSTCVPDDAKRLLYALARMVQSIEGGVGAQGFLQGKFGGDEEEAPMLMCLPSAHKGGKPLITAPVDMDGAMRSVPAMRTSLRVYKASRAETSAYYMWVTVCSPLPFSMRVAAYEILLRQRNEEWAAEVKRIWSMMATHARFPHRIMTDAPEEDKASAWGQNLDWMLETNDQSFTAMFSARRALEWLRLDFEKRLGVGPPDEVGGFEDPQQGTDGDFIKSCILYDVQVDKWHRQGLKKRKRQQQPQSTQESVVSEAAEEEEQPELMPPLPPLGCAWGDGKTGVPPCAYAMEMYVTLPESARSYAAFDSMVKTLPLSVQNGVCADMVGLRLPPAAAEDEDVPTLQQSRVIISGGYGSLQQIKRQFAAGDRHWHQHHLHSVLQLAPAERLPALHRMLQAAVQMSFARAEGSDGYTNSRAAAYMHYARSRAQAPSRRDCLLAREAVGGGGCGTTAALQAVGEVTMECNRIGFFLRPDNLHLLNLLCVSDLMQCLNFHNQAIRCVANGIGATIVIRNGGGHYKRADAKQVEFEVCSKTNGSGADITMGILISMLGDLRVYDGSARALQVFNEIRKSSEMGMLTFTCLRIETSGSEQTVSIAATDTSGRHYGTELRVQNDSASNATITALSQLIPRNTLADTENSINTTEEGAKTKQRVSIKWIQVLYGILLLSTNMTVDGPVYERYKTICKVARNVASGAQGLDEPREEEEQAAAGAGRLNFTSANPDTRSEELLRSARPLFFTGFGTAVCAAFLQWTGMLGDLQDCELFATAYRVFRAQLELSLAILDPEMAHPSSLGRSMQVSEARNVAHTLLVVALEESAEAGRRGEGQIQAVQGVGLRLMTAARHPATLPSLVCCTLEHMVRLDFMILMQMLAAAFRPPAEVQLEDVVDWVTAGRRCEAADQWLQGQTLLSEASLDKAEGVPPLRCGLYLRHDALECAVDNQQDVVRQVCRTLGARLLAEHTDTLRNHCQIHSGADGESIVQLMIKGSANKLMEWPRVFGGEPASFWECAPENATHRENMALAPVRVVQHQLKRASLVVDARWLLLMCSICGEVPCQSTRFALAGRWAQSFMQRCIPDRLWCASVLHTGLPCAYTRSERLHEPQHRRSGRTLFLRPHTEDPLVWKSQLCPTGVAEDMCCAWPRYNLARALGVPEAQLPAECVPYSLSPGCPVPVLLTGHPVQGRGEPFGLLTLDENGAYWLTLEDRQEQVTAREGGVGLRGRVTRAVRPLLELDRPGVAVVHPQTKVVDTLCGFDIAEGYRLSRGDPLHPLEAEARVVPIGTVLWLARPQGRHTPVMLALPPDNLAEGHLAVRPASAPGRYLLRVLQVPVVDLCVPDEEAPRFVFERP